MEVHVDRKTLAALHRGELAPETAVSVFAHVSACPDCNALAFEALRIPRLTQDVVDDLAEELTASSDKVSPDERRSIRWALPLAAAALLAVVVAVWVTHRTAIPEISERHPVLQRRPSASTYPSAWRDAVREATVSGTLPAPASLLRLQPAAEHYRQPGERTELPDVVAPASAVIETTRPHFIWRPVAGGRYVVSVYRHMERVASSGALDLPEWTCDRDLPRGDVYAWQVTVAEGSHRRTMPAPPHPPALFSIISDQDAAALAEARRKAPGDHLLLGVLAARAGLQTEAERELREAARNDRTGLAARLLENLQRWPVAPPR